MIEMDTKLTLSIDKTIITRVKKYARKEKKSLSKLAEDYFNRLSAPATENTDISPLVKKLSKVIKGTKDGDHRNAYAAHLSKKYSR